MKYTPKGKIYKVIKDYKELGLKKNTFFEYNKEEKIYILKNNLGEKVYSSLSLCNFSQLKVLYKLGIISK